MSNMTVRYRRVSLVIAISVVLFSGHMSWSKSMSSNTGSGDPLPGYLILTTPQIAASSASLAQFVAHKQSRGFDAAIALTDPNDPNWYVVGKAPEKMRNWLKVRYQAARFDYLLLIGNPDPNKADPNDALPMKSLDPAGEVASDIYYADLTGNWDLNGDGIYGSWGADFGAGGVDRDWELIVGRIPCYVSEPNWTSDLDSILLRTIAYQTQDSYAWRKSALLPMLPIDQSTPSYHVGEAIKDDILVPEGWAYHRAYEEDYGLSPVPETIEPTFDKIVTAWNSRPFGLVAWWTHGQPWAAADVMDVSHVGQLNDAYPSITFQSACLNSCPENTHNLSFELLKHGAICTIGATRPSFYYSGQRFFPGTLSSAGMAYEFTGRLVSAGMSAGQALFHIKRVMPPRFDRQWANYALFNLYGDPDTYLIPLRTLQERVHNQTLDTLYHDIQPAISAARNGDVIVLVPGVYTGPGNTDLDFGGKSITVRSTNPYDPTVIATTVIDPNGAGRGFNFHSGEGAGAVVFGLTITRGKADSGGGILCDAASPTIRSCIVRECEASETGGGVYCRESGNATMIACTLRGNSAAGYGGGLACNGASPVVRASKIQGNTAGVMGGGVACLENSRPAIETSRIEGNRSNTDAGGIGCYERSSATLQSCTISDNAANGVGGGVYCYTKSDLSLTHCTIAGNRASTVGGGVHVYDNCHLAVHYCILWSDAAAQGAEIALRDHSSMTLSYSDVQGGADAAYVETDSALSWGEGCMDSDPLFVDADGADNDPNTYVDNDYHISEDSPCAEAGDPNHDFTEYLDIDLELRVMGKKSDIGSDESSEYYGRCGKCGSHVQLPIPLLLLGGLRLMRRRSASC